jgi:hypothetical protein
MSTNGVRPQCVSDVAPRAEGWFFSILLGTLTAEPSSPDAAACIGFLAAQSARFAPAVERRGPAVELGRDARRLSLRKNELLPVGNETNGIDHLRPSSHGARRSGAATWLQEIVLASTSSTAR